MNGKQPVDAWLAASYFILIFALLTAIVGYVSRPPIHLQQIEGRVVAVGVRNHKYPKLNIFVDNGQRVVDLYTDLHALPAIPRVGDVVQAEYAGDPLGRNFHRVWALRSGTLVLMSSATSIREAAVEANKILLFGVAFFTLGILIILVRLAVRRRLGHAL